jgi:hypothetical protein
VFSDDRALFRTLFTPIASLPVFPAKPKPEGLRCRSDPNIATASYVPAIVNREQFNPLLPRTPLRTTSLSDEEELRFSAVMADAILTLRVKGMSDTSHQPATAATAASSSWKHR